MSRERDLVGHEHVAAAEGLVELHAVPAAAELTGDLQANLLVAVGVSVDAVDLGLSFGLKYLVARRAGFSLGAAARNLSRRIRRQTGTARSRKILNPNWAPHELSLPTRPTKNPA